MLETHTLPKRVVRARGSLNRKGTLRKSARLDNKIQIVQNV